MKKKTIITLTLLLITGLVIAQTVTLKGEQGTLIYDTTGIITKQKIGNCIIEEPINTNYEITYHDEKAQVFNYTASLSFNNKCVQGLGSNLQVSYQGTDMKTALINDLKTRFATEFSKKKTEETKERLKGSFKG